jgi:hypothetical protein
MSCVNANLNGARTLLQNLNFPESSVGFEPESQSFKANGSLFGQIFLHNCPVDTVRLFHNSVYFIRIS